MIPVCSRETDFGTKYIIEFDMLRKLSNSSSIDICEAYEAVCNENSISTDDTYVFVSESTTNILFECCC